ncbi:hypothetical protein PLICRDRAFT_39564 [Plicaturopsis crispa FD-325 SS-3]|nr:hypothetical protein PLICRDRAFT_39564 [Plicaturopsis crispa FD-325 SS-3]
MSFPTRKIGNTDVSAIGYGAMPYGKVGTSDDFLTFFDEVYSRGCTFWDTADIYGNSEELIGKWFIKTGKRKQIFLATKFGLVLAPDADRPANGEPSYMRQQFAKSLARLQTDYVDLYYLHRPDPKTPIEVTIGALAELVKEGKVKYLGLSECSEKTLRRAHAVYPISALQVEYSPFTLDIEDEKVGLLKAARELGVAIIAYSPLGRGLITGQYRSLDDFPENDYRRLIPRYNNENFPNILKLADGLKKLGEKYNATAGQIALAWLLAQGPGHDSLSTSMITWGLARSSYLRRTLRRYG